jgi:PTH1 family peptidyl-tRNA hydrolase
LSEASHLGAFARRLLFSGPDRGGLRFFSRLKVESEWKLIVGLGNPGDKYRNTRHNAGFMALASLAVARNLTNPVTFKRSLIVKARFDEIRVILAWPQTYMNLSGVAARELVNFYKLDSKSILVIHDDMDLEVGRVKVAMGGGTGGHNGLVSLLEELDFDFARIRIGVGRPERNLLEGGWSDWILSPPTSLELEAFDRSVKIAAEGAAIWAVSGLTSVQNKINKKPPKAKAKGD